jgi:hypothetical protein
MGMLGDKDGVAAARAAMAVQRSPAWPPLPEGGIMQAMLGVKDRT